jgi:hypothetical protein
MHRSKFTEREPDARVAYNFRCDGALLQRLAEAAKQELRSVNSEITVRLKASFERDQAAA